MVIGYLTFAKIFKYISIQIVVPLWLFSRSTNPIIAHTFLLFLSRFDGNSWILMDNDQDESSSFKQYYGHGSHAAVNETGYTVIIWRQNAVFTQNPTVEPIQISNAEPTQHSTDNSIQFPIVYPIQNPTGFPTAHEISTPAMNSTKNLTIIPNTNRTTHLS